MANNYFQFKQFIIYQDKCAMKVCTDACLFGAWAVKIIRNEPLKLKTILDIGTGTGLLSLMLAQKIAGHIDAVEIDSDAFEQATENFKRSPWSNMLKTHHASLQDYSANERKYDIIISNPPFYENDLKSDDEKKNNAKHDTSLALSELAEYAGNNLKDEGSLFVLLPYHRIADFITAADDSELFLKNELLVKQTHKHDFFRGCLHFTKKREPMIVKKISIKDEQGEYPAEFTSLLKDYYLNL